MADDDDNTMCCVGCCCLGIIILMIIGMFGGGGSSSSADNVADTVADAVNNSVNDSFGVKPFDPTNFRFVYSDGNTTTYKGDLGLQETFCINRADNNSVCRLDQEYTRGLAFASNGTFKFNENLSMVPYNFTRNDSDYTIKEIYHEDGSVLKKLRIEDDLTLEQRQYFQNYEQQKEEYYLKKQQDTLEIMEEEQYDTYATTVKNNEKTKHGIIYGPRGASYYRSF